MTSSNWFCLKPKNTEAYAETAYTRQDITSNTRYNFLIEPEPPDAVVLLVSQAESILPSAPALQRRQKQIRKSI